MKHDCTVCVTSSPQWALSGLKESCLATITGLSSPSKCVDFTHAVWDVGKESSGPSGATTHTPRPPWGSLKAGLCFLHSGLRTRDGIGWKPLVELSSDRQRHCYILSCLLTSVIAFFCWLLGGSSTNWRHNLATQWLFNLDSASVISYLEKFQFFTSKSAETIWVFSSWTLHIRTVEFPQIQSG